MAIIVYKKNIVVSANRLYGVLSLVSNQLHLYCKQQFLFSCSWELGFQRSDKLVLHVLSTYIKLLYIACVESASNDYCKQQFLFSCSWELGAQR